MEEILNIPCIVESCRWSRGLVCFPPITWFPRIDALEDTKSPEIRQGHLKFPDCSTSGNEVFCLTRVPLVTLAYGFRFA